MNDDDFCHTAEELYGTVLDLMAGADMETAAGAALASDLEGLLDGLDDGNTAAMSKAKRVLGIAAEAIGADSTLLAIDIDDSRFDDLVSEAAHCSATPLP